MKTLYLVCNSHLDPVWQWDWNEGASATLATFYSAVELADKYDYIFCHNEVLLYEYIEKYDKELFDRIQKLVSEGKWKIMGGWYVQPDCLVPSGESFIRQSSLGRKYFSEKFNSRPTVAINFDAFGHTRGLPTILKKCGYDSYVFCRSMPWLHPMEKEDLPHGPFLWEGYDGSKVKALRYEDDTIYCSRYGYAKEDILRKAGKYSDCDDVLVLWGVGNHGGVSSAKDIEDIATLIDEKKGEWKILHSTLEDYFNAVSPTEVISRQIITFVKSYSSVSAIKLVHDQLENALYLAEKMCTVAELDSDYRYDKQVFERAEKVLAQIEFHDVLSGTAIKIGTDSSIRKAHHAIEELKAEMFGAFVAKAKALKSVIPNDDNLVIFNPYPYEYKGLAEAEFFIQDAIVSDTEQYHLRLYDKNGKDLPMQIIREDSILNMDRRKRVLFEVTIPAFGVVSVGINKSVGPKTKIAIDKESDIVISDKHKKVVINRKTGLIDSFEVEGKEYLKAGAFRPVCFNDNEDPWGWFFNTLGKVPYHDEKSGPVWSFTKQKFVEFKLDNSGKGVFENLSGVSILEEGELLTQVQALFTKGESHVVMNYKIYKNQPYIDIDCHVLWNEKAKGLKLKVPFAFNSGYFAQMAFGVENYTSNGYEYPCNRYVGATKKGEKSLVVYNKSGIHSVSKQGANMYLTLLNGSAYCAHPVDFRPLVPNPELFVPYIEQGVHDFSFRVQVNNASECEKVSNQFNQPLYALSFFPHGEGNEAQDAITLSNSEIVISALKRLDDGDYLIRLYNGTNKPTHTLLNIKGTEKEIKFKKFEFVTLRYNGAKITVANFADEY